MAEITFVTSIKRVEAQPGGQIPPPPQSEGLPAVVAVVGIPGRPGKDGPAGPPGESAGEYVDPGDLTLLFDNKLI